MTAISNPAAAVVPAPVRGALAEVAGMVVLVGVVAARLASAPRWSYARDIGEASWIVARRCTLPLALSVFVLGFGALGVEAGQSCSTRSALPTAPAAST